MQIDIVQLITVCVSFLSVVVAFLTVLINYLNSKKAREQRIYETIFVSKKEMTYNFIDEMYAFIHSDNISYSHLIPLLCKMRIYSSSEVRYRINNIEKLLSNRAGAISHEKRPSVIPFRGDLLGTCNSNIEVQIDEIVQLLNFEITKGEEF